jgi:hypothetical protein
MFDQGEHVRLIAGHVRRSPARYGVTTTRSSDEMDDNAFADHVIGLAGTLPVDGFEGQIKVRLSSYMASLLGADAQRINAILHLTLAALDKPIRDLATLVSYGMPADRRIHAVPLDGLALLMEGDDLESGRTHPLMVGDMYVGTRIIEAVHLTRSRHHVTGEVTLNEHPVCKVGQDEFPANGLKLEDHILHALIGRWNEIENLMTASADLTRPAAPDLDLIAPDGRTGMQIAYRSDAPDETAIAIGEQVQASGHDVVLVHEIEENSVLISLVAAQAHACLQQARKRPIPVCVVPDTWSLVGASLYQSAEPALGATGIAEQTVQYDTDLMTYQKDILRIIGGEILSPIVWVLEHGVPVSSGLLGMFSRITTAPKIDLRHKADTVREIARLNGVRIDDATAMRLAGYTPNPEELAGAFRGAAKMADQGAIEEACKDILRASGLDRPVPSTDKAGFDIRLVEAQITMVEPETGELITRGTLERAIELFVEKRDRPIKILLHGKPGTSKTTLAHHIANRLGMEILEVKPSTILDRWLGSSEQKIQEVFRKATAARKFIIIDEVDTFMSARGGNQASYEKSGTNEWLIQMQNHGLPMACTTNHLEMIDPAAVRRFLFKIEVKPLDTVRARIAWSDLLRMPADQCPNPDDLDGLTVNDFAIVAEKMMVLDITSPKFARQSLIEERKTREQHSSARIGFFT